MSKKQRVDEIFGKLAGLLGKAAGGASSKLNSFSQDQDAKKKVKKDDKEAKGKFNAVRKKGQALKKQGGPTDDQAISMHRDRKALARQRLSKKGINLGGESAIPGQADKQTKGAFAAKAPGAFDTNSMSFGAQKTVSSPRDQFLRQMRRKMAKRRLTMSTDLGDAPKVDEEKSVDNEKNVDPKKLNRGLLGVRNRAGKHLEKLGQGESDGRGPALGDNNNKPNDSMEARIKARVSGSKAKLNQHASNAVSIARARGENLDSTGMRKTRRAPASTAKRNQETFFNRFRAKAPGEKNLLTTNLDNVKMPSTDDREKAANKKQKGGTEKQRAKELKNQKHYAKKNAQAHKTPSKPLADRIKPTPGDKKAADYYDKEEERGPAKAEFKAKTKKAAAKALRSKKTNLIGSNVRKNKNDAAGKKDQL